MARLVTTLALATLILQTACGRTVVVRSTVPVEVAWVCHGETSPRWLRVRASQVEFHERHGDWVSVEPRRDGAVCEAREPAQPAEPAPPPREPEEPRAPMPQLRIAWVCHGEVNRRWMRVDNDAAIETHRLHGDAISVQPQQVGTRCGPAAQQPPEPSEPVRPREPRPQEPAPESEVAWVCHGEVNPRWLRVPVPAAEAHARHGDPVSMGPQQPGTPCERAEEEPPRRERSEQPPEPPRPPEPTRRRQVPEPQYAWVCHGAVNPRWLRVAASAAEAHGSHGDIVSMEPQEVGAACERDVPERPAPERPAEPRRPREPSQPGEPSQPQPERQFAWVCHGEENPRWLRVAALAAEAHENHGDIVSMDPQEVGAACKRDEPERPAPERPEAPRRPREPGQPGEPSQPQPERQFAWVCHGDTNPQWLRVAAPAVETHREHGDPVSLEEQEVGTACDRTQPEPPAPERRDQPRQPRQPPEPGEPNQPEPEFAWVCHGERTPRWLRVPVSAVEAHERHGDPVSMEQQEEGTVCERGG